MKKIKFSIITPSYNQAEFIEQNIKSVLDQRYDNFEHIIIDGGSIDGTVAILKKYGHLKWLSEKDNGQSDALNKGLKIATGDVICWINSDDELADDALQIAAKYFEQYPDRVAVSGARINIDFNGNVIKVIPSKSYTFKCLLNYDKDINQPSTFFRKELFNGLGEIRNDLHYAMDYELFLRITRKYEIESIPQPLSRFRIHAYSKTGSQSLRMLREQFIVRREYGGKYFCKATIKIINASVVLISKNILGETIYYRMKAFKKHLLKRKNYEKR